MFGLCLRKTSTISKCIMQQNVHQSVISKLKITGDTLNNLTRYSTKSKEDSNTEIIYYGTLTPQIKAVKVFSLSSSAAGLIAQPIIIKEAETIGSTGLLIGLCSVVGFFTFVTPILLHLITKKYVTEIKYNPDTSTYTATTINFFLAQKQLEFTPDDVVVPDIPGMFTTMKVKGKPMFIEARHFNDPIHYAKIMGYDKPIDFKLGQVDTDDTENKFK